MRLNINNNNNNRPPPTGIGSNMPCPSRLYREGLSILQSNNLLTRII